ncbi:B-cell antigen receptor complex-associated protein alpha chain [Polymixia lowei]
MVAVKILILCSFVAVAQGVRVQVTLEPDRPSIRVQFFDPTTVRCCYNASGGVVNYTWMSYMNHINGTVVARIVNESDHRVTKTENQPSPGAWCQSLTIREVQFNDTALYRCLLTHRDLKPPVYSHGTYLQVYMPIKKTINISESNKNRILTAEGILLLLIVILPGATLLFKSKKLNQLERIKMKKEEENIYEGLNLEDCSTPYDQIQRSQAHDPYEDVYVKEEEEIQLEKP